MTSSVIFYCDYALHELCSVVRFIPIHSHSVHQISGVCAIFAFPIAQVRRMSPIKTGNCLENHWWRHWKLGRLTAYVIWSGSDFYFMHSIWRYCTRENSVCVFWLEQNCVPIEKRRTKMCENWKKEEQKCVRIEKRRTKMCKNWRKRRTKMCENWKKKGKNV